MARLRFTVKTEGEEALAAATAETVLQVVAPTNQDVALLGWSVSFDASALTEAVQVQLVRQTGAGTSSAGTPVKDDNRVSTTIQSASRKDFTAEPTDGDVLRHYDIQPASGGAEMRYSIEDELIIGAGTRLGLKVTAPAVVNVLAHMACEE